MPKSKPGCFMGIIRQMLCTKNTPKNPSSSSSSDHITKSNNATKINNPESEQKDHHTTTKRESGPTLVARLMGLETLPPKTNSALKNTAPESLTRSRSVNFVDYLLKLDDVAAESRAHNRHRRAITSVSFREVPPQTTSFHRNDAKRNYGDDKRILKPTKEPQRKVLTKASKKSFERRNGVLGSVERRESKCSLRNDCGAEKLKASNTKREFEKKATEKFVRKRKNQHRNKKIQPIESNHENLSPVSVLDDTLFSERQSGQVEDLELKMKLKPTVAYHIRDDFKLRSADDQKKNYGKNRVNKDIVLDYAELANQLVNLTKHDLSESYWLTDTKIVIDFEGFEEICMEFEGLILDVLLQEVTGEILQI